MAKNTGRGGRRNQRLNRPPPSSSPITPPSSAEHFTGRTLPGDVIIEILCRTPVKSLIRFRCVSKSWYALIHHSKFIHKHLQINKLCNTHVILNAYNNHLVRNTSRKLVSVLRVDDDTPIPLLDIDTRVRNRVGYPQKINFVDFAKRMILAGSINGVVLVTHTDEMNGRFVALWNPSINCWKPIRICKEAGSGVVEGVTRSSVGLAFDEDIDDFKIIRIVTRSSLSDFYSDFGWSRVEIYSAKWDCWKDIKEGGVISFWPQLPHCNFVLKGVPYFVGVDEMPDSIGFFQHEVLVGFDPRTGLPKKFTYPERDRNTWVHPFLYKDSIAATVQSSLVSQKPTIDFYVLDDNTSNWTKIYKIGPLPIQGFHFPKQSFNTGEIVLEFQVDGGIPYLYVPKANCLRGLSGIRGLDPLWYESYSHTESLVSIKGMELIGKEDKNKKTKPKKLHRTHLLSKDFESVLHL